MSTRTLSVLMLVWYSESQAPGYSWGGGACITDEDCSLGGVCSSSLCICDAYFTGPDCSLLNLQRPRLDDQAGLCHKGFSSYYSWGGKSILGQDGRWHLYASFMCNHATLDQWTTKSSSAHFVSDTVDGAYVFADSECDATTGICTPIVIPWSHNTVIAENAKGKTPALLLAHIGDGVVDPSQWAPCFNKSDVKEKDEDSVTSSTLNSPLIRGDPGSTCYFATSDAPDGPWTRSLNNTGVVINFTNSWTNGLAGNPAPLINQQDGSVKLYFTAVPCPPNSNSKAPNCIAVATAESWEGPYSMNEAKTPITYPESEDPFVFVDQRGNYHLVTNVNTFHARCAQGVPCGGHAWSRDGLTFSNLTIGAFGPVVTFLNGTEWKNAYAERPLVTMASDGVTPLAFSLGLGRNSYSDSCNWVQLFCTNGSDPNCGPTRFAM